MMKDNHLLQDTNDEEEIEDDKDSAITAPTRACRVRPLSGIVKNIQLVKMLCLTVIPILGLWGFSFFTLQDTIYKKTENEKTKNELKLSVELGTLIHRLQEERDMSVLYLSALGPETKTFLLTKYIETDRAINALSEWPSNLDNEKRTEFESKEKLREYLSRHRQLLSKTKYDIDYELDFYTNIIDVVIIWLYRSITQGKFAQVWKTLVAYLKLTSGKQVVGIERALGTLFYVQGGFTSQHYFEMYNTRINWFNAFYNTAELYSPRVDRLYTVSVQNVGTNITGTISSFRREIQFHSGTLGRPDIRKAQFWFDNMTLYLDTLLDIQIDLGFEIIEKLDKVISASVTDLSVSATALVAVLIMCPVVIYASENMTSSIQKYAQTLITKTKQLSKQKKKIDAILYRMVPQEFAEKLKNKEPIDAEYFQSITVMYYDIYNFDYVVANCTPEEIVTAVNYLIDFTDALCVNCDVYKMDFINEGFMVASGLPQRNGEKHVTTIANFALRLLRKVEEKEIIIKDQWPFRLRIGVSTGPCTACIVGTVLPRYCMFGESVMTALMIKQNACPNRIQISHATNIYLSKYSEYSLEKRSNIEVKGRGSYKTYWLQSRADNEQQSPKPSNKVNTQTSGASLNE